MKKPSLIEEAAASEDRAHAQYLAPSAQLIETRMIPLKKLIPSPTQPRKRFNIEEARKMEASMREHGFTLSAILVRPWLERYRIDAINGNEGQIFIMGQVGTAPERTVTMPANMAEAEAELERLNGCFEIVAGERRWRGATAAGIVEAPCIVRELSDQKVVEQQLVENLQRSDLTPLETAMGFGALLVMKDAEGRTVHNEESIAKSVGVSRGHVVKYLRLRAIAEDADLAEFRKAFEDGVVGFRHALQVARMPDAKLRAKLVAEILHPQFDEAPLSVRKLEHLVQSKYMIDLRNAPFDIKDVNLVPVKHDSAGARLCGGDCLSCPQRMANSPEMFDGELPKSLALMCLYPSCHAEKAAKGWERWQRENTDPEKNRRALSEEESRALFTLGDQIDWNSGYVKLDEAPDSSDLKPGEETPGKWRKLVKGSEIEILVAKDRNGRDQELVKREVAVAAAETNGFQCFKKKQGQAGMVESDAAVLEREDARETESAAGDALATAAYTLALKSKEVPVGFWPFVAQQCMEDYVFSDAAARVEGRHEITAGNFVPYMEKLPEDRQFALFVELLVEATDGDLKVRLLKCLGVDEKTIRKEVKAKVKQEQKARRVLVDDVREAARKANLPDKTLDKMALGFDADSFGKLRDMEALRQILATLESEMATKGAPAKPEPPEPPADVPKEDRRVTAAKGPKKPKTKAKAAKKGASK